VTDWAIVFERLERRIESYGVAVLVTPLGLETTGLFDGLTITTNALYDAETRSYNSAHSLGHIAQWSLDYVRFEKLYKELHAAKAGKAANPEALERALEQFRRYEEEASQYAAWLLADIDAGSLSSFTLFARADIEAIVAFHRHGAAPCWHRFFDDWQRRVERGEITAQPFRHTAIPAFTPVSIPVQEVIRGVEERDPAPQTSARVSS
jgi:hypothetical protein